jgi:hypothetical protein
MSAEVALERAERGAALLDEKVPGWEHRIDLGRLEMEHSCRCVLGQVFKVSASGERFGTGYWTGARKLGVQLNPSVGFLCGGMPFVTYSELEEAWIHILKRRADLGVFSDTGTDPDPAGAHTAQQVNTSKERVAP